MSLEEWTEGGLSEQQVGELAQRVAGMALLHGVEKRVTYGSFPERVEPMPFTLFPSIVPADVLQQATALHTEFQKLMHRLSTDHEVLSSSLKYVLPVDDFTRELWNIYTTVREEGVAQPISIMLTRNDFMMEAIDIPSPHAGDQSTGTRGHHVTNGDLKLKQIEFNTFSAGAGGVITAMPDVHRYSLSLTGIPFTHEQLPDNAPAKGLAQGLVKAWELYNNSTAKILFVVGPPEPNQPDQRWLEREIYRRNRGIRILYRTFALLHDQVTLNSEKILMVDGAEIGVVYYRYGYVPKHYPTHKEYGLRLTIERSRAIKCPTVVQQVTGCKKLQQELARPGVLERLIADPGVVAAIRATFVGLYTLEKRIGKYIAPSPITLQKQGDAGDANARMAISDSDKFVMKPQLEGGGNNLFGPELKARLEEMFSSCDRYSYILMDRIRAFPHTNRLILPGLGPERRQCNSELGIFGVYIGTASDEIMNTAAGYMLRSKPVETNEGGLFIGPSCLDSPFVV